MSLSYVSSRWHFQSQTTFFRIVCSSYQSFLQCTGLHKYTEVPKSSKPVALCVIIIERDRDTYPSPETLVCIIHGITMYTEYMHCILTYLQLLSPVQRLKQLCKYWNNLFLKDDENIDLKLKQLDAQVYDLLTTVKYALINCQKSANMHCTVCECVQVTFAVLP